MKTKNLILGSVLTLCSIASSFAQQTGLVGHYPFNNNANDESGNNNHGVVSNATLAADRFGNANSAYYFNGTTSIISVIHNSSSINFTGNFSISLWFKAFKGYNTRSGLLYTRMNANGNEQGGFGMDYAPSGYDSTVTFYKAGTNNLSTGYLHPKKVTTDTWHNLVITYGTVASGIGKGYMYIDGVKTDSTANPFVDYFVASSPLRIGAVINASGLTQVFKGWIDDIRIYNKVVSKYDATALYNENITGSGTTSGQWSGIIGTSNIYNTTLGSVGIGLTNPLHKLSINGNIYIQNPQPNGTISKFLVNLGLNTLSQPTFSISPSATNGNGWNANRDFVLDQSGLMTKKIDGAGKAFTIYRTDLSKEVFRVTGDGKVYATELNIKLASAFPDYVFQKNYTLMSLDNLEKYVAENTKLPNIPSASEVATNGMEVGELQKLQMEKIEELTLYILQLNRRIEQLEVELKLNK